MGDDEKEWRGKKGHWEGGEGIKGRGSGDIRGRMGKGEERDKAEGKRGGGEVNKHK